MPQVALYWNQNRILVAIARQAAGKIQFERALSVELHWGEEEEPNAPRRLGEKLKAVLSANGVTKGDATVVVSRSAIEMRQFELPPVPAEELPELVQFQARTQFSSLTDDWAVDYISLSNNHSNNSVLATAISPEKLDEIRKTIEPTGLKLKHIVVGPFAAAELWRSRNPDATCQFIVEPSGRQANLSVIDSGYVLFTRTVRVPESYTHEQFESWLPGEVHRTIAAARNQSDAPEITKVVVCGKASDHTRLEQGLAEKLEIETEFFEPFDAVSLRRGFEFPDQFDGFASLLGSIVQQTLPNSRSIDFLNPRRKPESTALKQKMRIGGGIAAAVMLIGVVVCWWILRSKDRQIADLQEKVDVLVESTAKTDMIIDRVAKVDSWKKGDVQWLEELFELSDRFPYPDDAILDRFAGSVGDDATIQLRGRIKDGATLSELTDQLEQRYTLDTKSMSPPPGGGDLNVGFVRDLKLEPVDVTKIGRQPARESAVENVNTGIGDQSENTSEVEETNQ